MWNAGWLVYLIKCAIRELSRLEIYLGGDPVIMQSNLDQAITAAAAAEAVFTTDQTNISTIQQAIATATAPLAAAQAQSVTDATAYNSALDALIAAATAAKVPTS